MSLVRLDQTVKTFGGLKAVDEVSFAIDRGEVVGFLGPNGAGKTTTMRLITANLEADSGTVEVDGAPVGEKAEHSAPLSRMRWRQTLKCQGRLLLGLRPTT